MLLTDKGLWVVREEERLAFETTQLIQMTDGASGVHDVVQDFAILVPSTNFPPALDYVNAIAMISHELEIIDVEFMYEYFIRVRFANGTTEDISAGLTSFQPLYDPTDTLRRPTSGTTVLQPRHIIGTGKDLPITNYTAQVTGLVFSQDSEDQIVTVVITRTGPARTFTELLRIETYVEPSLSSKWAVEYDMPSTRPLRNPGLILRSIPEDVEEAKSNRWRPSWHHGSNAPVSIAMPNSTSDEIQSGKIVTTSAAITIPVKVDRRHVTNFKTYYQTLANSLQIMLTTPRSKDETVDPDDPSAEAPVHWRPEFADDEELWVSWEKKAASEIPQPKTWGTYTGRVLVVVRPTNKGATPRQCLRTGADMSHQLVLSGLPDEARCKQRSLIHYLSEGARGPTFVDRRAVHELLAEDATERELRAPILEPMVSSVPEGEEIIYRYHHQLNPRKPLIYVGETWIKKVVNKGEYEATPGVHDSKWLVHRHLDPDNIGYMPF